MAVVDSIVPILLVLGLGAALGRGGLLAERFVDDLNRLVYWVGIPCLVVHALAVASAPAARALAIAGALLATTALALLVGLAVAAALRLRRAAWGTFLQASFRGNLAFVGLPVLLYSARGRAEDLLALAVLAMAPIVLVHNLLAVSVLLASRRRLDRRGLAELGREVVTNPLILSCLAGALVAAAPFRLPIALLRALETVGHIAIPLALLAIGASLARARLAGRWRPALAASAIKAALIPAAAFLAGRLLGLDGPAFRILVVFAACPTAATSNVLAARLGGDEAMASAAIVLSTVLSAASLSLVLAAIG